jgi:flagellar FliL protein
MAEEAPAPEHSDVKTDGAKEKSGMIKKLLIFGVPAFLVQLVLVYFLTAKFIVPITIQHNGSKAAVQSVKDERGNQHSSESDGASEEGEAKEQHIYVVKDLIINPAGTNGQRYLLSTIAFNVSTEEGLKELETKEMAVRDLLNSILTSKTMEQLIDVTQRESLRQEIGKRAEGMIANGKLLSVYFSKYIVQ